MSETIRCVMMICLLNEYGKVQYIKPILNNGWMNNCSA